MFRGLGELLAGVEESRDGASVFQVLVLEWFNLHGLGVLNSAVRTLRFNRVGGIGLDSHYKRFLGVALRVVCWGDRIQLQGIPGYKTCALKNADYAFHFCGACTISKHHMWNLGC